jgi:hypothetical protein
MKDLREADSDYWYTYYSYNELIDSMEVDVLVEVSDDDYQGDTRILLKQGESFGILTFGWGSCSGCDALQGACDDGRDAVIALRDGLWESIIWKDSAEDMIEYLKAKDWSLDYMPMKEFPERALQALRA